MEATCVYVDCVRLSSCINVIGHASLLYFAVCNPYYAILCSLAYVLSFIQFTLRKDTAGNPFALTSRGFALLVALRFATVGVCWQVRRQYPKGCKSTSRLWFASIIGRSTYLAIHGQTRPYMGAPVPPLLTSHRVALSWAFPSTTSIACWICSTSRR